MKTIKGNQGQGSSKKKAVSTAPAKPETPKSRRLDMVVPPGITMDKAVTDMAAAGLATNAGLVVKFSQAEHGELSLTDMVASLRDAGQAVNDGDLRAAEQMLNAQAVSLNSIFAELARRAAMNMGEYMDATERYMRLALKAQGQCRATLETLAAIKNPPVVFAKQANISSGPQQVNNGVFGVHKKDGEQATPTHGEKKNEQTKLLEDKQHGGTILDAGAATAPARGNSKVEAVGTIQRPENPRRKKQG
ncbi:hypothetical protein [Caenimonas aquaedulcis]|uniref:Phasin domain-containing protein n=1 Tax=Caenimonas aquaedulcis TaxID=2793270 RepID=A0A931MI06_9BURK|nr:hypothetical protein [Caenimonas aquaedulcis]MBG9389329.1 hypothetical protein [Caenimonas aquaedulcis]